MADGIFENYPHDHDHPKKKDDVRFDNDTKETKGPMITDQPDIEPKLSI